MLKEALSLKFGGMEELGEKMCIIGELGKLLLEEVPLEETPPGYGRAPYNGYEKTANAANEAARCVSFSDLGNSKLIPSSPEYNSTLPTAHPNHLEQHTINIRHPSRPHPSNKNESLPLRNSQTTPETSLRPKQKARTEIQPTDSTRTLTEATKQIKTDTKNSEVSRKATEVHRAEIRSYGKALPKRLCLRMVSGNSNKGMITSMNSRGKSTLLHGRNKVNLRLLPNILMGMDTTQSTLPPRLLHGSP